MTIRIHKSQLKQELLSIPVLTGGVTVSLLYIIISTLLMNRVLIAETISGKYQVTEKLAILGALIRAVPTLYTPFELGIILLMGFLMGINIVLLAQSLRMKSARDAAAGGREKGKISLGVGFMGMVATTGCASCGITLISFLGPTASLSLLPFQGLFIQGISLGLLVFSLINILNQRNKPCLILSR